MLEGHGSTKAVNAPCLHRVKPPWQLVQSHTVRPVLGHVRKQYIKEDRASTSEPLSIPEGSGLCDVSV